MMGVWVWEQKREGKKSRRLCAAGPGSIVSLEINRSSLALRPNHGFQSAPPPPLPKPQLDIQSIGTDH